MNRYDQAVPDAVNEDTLDDGEVVHVGRHLVYKYTAHSVTMDQETGNGFSVRRTRKKSSYLVSALIFVYPAHVQRALPGASFFIGCRLQGSAFSATDRANFRRTSRIWARVPQTIRSSNQNLKMVRLRCMFTLYIFVCKTAGRTYIFSVAFFFTRIGNYLQARVRVKFPHGEQ